MSSLNFWIKKLRWFAVIVTVLVATSDIASSHNVSPISHIMASKRTERRACGKTLANMARHICSEFRSKKSVVTYPYQLEYQDESETNNLQPHYNFKDYEAATFPFTDRMAGVIIPALYKGKRSSMDYYASLVSECCDKSCTLKEITGYCDGNGNFNMES